MSNDLKGKLKQLIEDGEKFKGQVKRSDFVGSFISGEDYEKWVAKGVIFVEKYYPEGTATKRFLGAAEKAVGNSPSYLDTMLGVLKALLEMEE